MDRASLEQLLHQGLSLAEIGRRVGLHESTVAYWVQKHGLQATNRTKHAAKGALTRADLQPLVEAGLLSGQIAEKVGRSKTTVRHWLRDLGLKTQWSSRQEAWANGQAAVVIRCPRHGVTPFSRRSAGGYRCNKCRGEAVTRRRRKVKRVLVEEAGGACVLCGYDRCVAALQFHHLDPDSKQFGVAQRGHARSLERVRAEVRKCLLLCSNCHAEVESGFRSISGVARLDDDPG